MNRDPVGGTPQHLPAPDLEKDPVEDTHAWTSTGFAVARVRGVWKNDLLDKNRSKLDRDRREGTWGALARAMARAHGGQWTARAIRTLRGLAGSLHGGAANGSEALSRDKREAILEIAAKHGARNVRVFGSFARGNPTATSDLDLLVDVGSERSPFFPGGLIAELENCLGVKVDVVTEAALHWYIRERVMREAIPL